MYIRIPVGLHRATVDPDGVKGGQDTAFIKLYTNNNIPIPSKLPQLRRWCQYQ